MLFIENSLATYAREITQVTSYLLVPLITKNNKYFQQCINTRACDMCIDRFSAERFPRLNTFVVNIISPVYVPLSVSVQL